MHFHHLHAQEAVQVPFDETARATFPWCAQRISILSKGNHSLLHEKGTLFRFKQNLVRLPLSRLPKTPDLWTTNFSSTTLCKILHKPSKQNYPMNILVTGATDGYESHILDFRKPPRTPAHVPRGSG